jgi:hypothetical protein
MKYWIVKEGGGDNLIVISDTVIYCSRYSAGKLREFENKLINGQIPKALSGTSFGYIKYIEVSNKSSKIKIYYGKESDMKLVIKDENIRSEIIEYLKEDKVNLPSYKKEHLSKLNASLKPLLFLMIACVVIYYIADIAAEIEGGAEYEVHGRSSGQAMGNLVIGSAQILGVKGVLMVGAIPILILLYKLVRNIQSPPIIETLDYRNRIKTPDRNI